MKQHVNGLLVTQHAKRIKYWVEIMQNNITSTILRQGETGCYDIFFSTPT